MSKYQPKQLDLSEVILNEIEKIVGVTRVLETKENGEVKTIVNWIVLSSSDEVAGLYILAETDEAVKSMTYKLRGIVVDVKNQVIVADSFGYNPLIRQTELPPKAPFSLEGLDGQEYVIDKHDKLYPGLPGVVIRVFRHGGKTYVASYKSLDVMSSTSRYAGITFMDAITTLGGIDTEALFPPGAGDYSPYVYYFIVVHPQLFGASKMPLHMANITYLRSSKMWTPDQVSFARSDIDNKHREPQNLVKFRDLLTDTTRDPMTRDSNEYVVLESLNPRQATRFLRTGYYSVNNGDSRDDYFLPGSFIMAYRFEDDGTYSDILRIESYSYAWRSTILAGEQNFRLRFYQLLDLMRGQYRYNFTSDGYSEGVFWKKKFEGEKIYNFPKYTNESIRELIADNKLLIWPYTPDVYRTNPALTEDQELAVWYNLLYVVPQVHQEEVFNLYEEFILDLNTIYWLFLNPEVWEPMKDSKNKYEPELYFFFKALQRHADPNKRQALRYDMVPKTSGYLLFKITKITSDLFLKYITENAERLIKIYTTSENPEHSKITNNIKDYSPVVNNFMTKKKIDQVSVEEMLIEMDFEDYLQLEEYLLLE